MRRQLTKMHLVVGVLASFDTSPTLPRKLRADLNRPRSWLQHRTFPPAVDADKNAFPVFEITTYTHPQESGRQQSTKKHVENRFL